MYPKNVKQYRGTIKGRTAVEGDSLHVQIERMIQNKEKVDLTSAPPLIYTEKKDGVLPEYNVRADKMEIMAEAGDKIAKSYDNREKRDAKLKAEKGGLSEDKKDDTSGQSTQGK